MHLAAAAGRPGATVRWRAEIPLWHCESLPADAGHRCRQRISPEYPNRLAPHPRLCQLATVRTPRQPVRTAWRYGEGRLAAACSSGAMELFFNHRFELIYGHHTID